MELSKTIANEEEKLKKFIVDNKIAAEHLHFESSLHTVKQCVDVSGFPIEQITKTMIFKESQGKTIAAMVPAKFRVSVSRLVEASGFQNLELATLNDAYEITGYPAGGMPCFGYEAILVIDPIVLEQEYVYTGGGSEFSMAKISTSEITRIRNPIVHKIRGEKSN